MGLVIGTCRESNKDLMELAAPISQLDVLILISGFVSDHKRKARKI